MAFVNVNRENTDQFYRYKMPSLIAKVEGKGNGIKTVVVNMTEIGKALGRPPSYPCKYFGCELGAQTQMDAKNNRYIVNGAHEGSKLQGMLDGFIRKFVLCPECENPETDLDVQSGKGRIVQRCQACGSTGLVDQRHKLTTFILKNPPGSNGDAVPSSKKERKQRGKEKHSKGKGSKDKEPTSPGADEDFDSMPVFSQSNGQPPLSANSIDKDEDWSMDTSKAAVKARMEKLTDGAAVLTVVDDLEKPTNERMDMFFKFVEQMKKQGGAGTIAANLGKIKSEVSRLDLTDVAAGIMAEILYSDRLLDEIKEYRPIMLHFVVDNKKAQRKLLGAFEILVGKEYPQLMSRVPHILKAFYDNDLLEEEVILEWDGKIKKHVSKEKAKEIRAKATPFVNWLRTAEEETSDEEEDVEVEYSAKAAQSKLTVVSEPSPSVAAQLGAKEEDDDEEDDVNIDDI